MKESVAYASFPLQKPEAGTNLPPGMVQVSVFVPAQQDIVWAAVTKRAEVRKWFGDLSNDLKPGGALRLDFGDADFFEIADVALDPPRAMQYQWRFLGTGPSNAIEWNIAPESGGVRVTVSDREPNRSAAMVEELTEGWTDFLRRLQVHGATGQNTRYTWRRQFDGGIELPAEPEAAALQLLSDGGQDCWLPWTGQIAPGATVSMIDDRQPKLFQIRKVDRVGPLALNFEFGSAQWQAFTRCEIQIQPRPEGSLLVVSHSGWEEISDSDAERGAQRQRFGELWIAAMRRAKLRVSN
jgi:uncharacterized protein YndB with AHSA1/START domain